MADGAHGPSEGELFKKILGPEWLKLHPDIQRRFDKNPVPGKPLRYTGTLDELKSSFMGKVLGFLTFPLIKGALIPFDDADFPVDIQVYCKPDSDAIFKQRIYRLNGRKPIQFTSYMRESAKGEVLEYVGWGLGMKLIVSIREGSLHFRSDGYFWDILGLRIPLPDVLTPGATDLIHMNVGENRFRIRIVLKHSLFGVMFTQAGEFWELAKSEVEQSTAAQAFEHAGLEPALKDAR